jgi:D-glycero-alpha-D-manno-heptose-7-phosphate kinase
MHVGMAPVRISFAGGGTDIPEYYEKFGGNVISTNINLFTYVVVNARKDESFQAFSSDFQMYQSKISYDKLEPKFGTEIAVAVVKQLGYRTGGDFLICSDVKPGSGLGSSSTLAVNFINTISTLNGENWSKEKIAETAYHIEHDLLHHPIGKQDDYIAAMGGFRFIQFQQDKITVESINLNNSSLQELDENLLLFFIGDTRNSSIVLSKQTEKIKSHNTETINALHSVKEIGLELHDSLKNSDLTKFGEILHKGWVAKQKFTDGITNEKIDFLYNLGLKHGALGGKLTGAGGGGHLLFYTEKSKHRQIIDEMKNHGVHHVPFKFHSGGPKVLNLYDFNK